MTRDRPTHLLYQTVHRKPVSAGYVTRPNPLSLAERVPVLQQFRFLGPDIIAQDPAEIAAEVFGFLGVRYVILHEYMLPSGEEREATLALVDDVFGGQSPVYRDGRITVYLAGGEEGDSPFLILGEGWGRRHLWGGMPARAVGQEASLTIVAPGDTETSLTFTAFSSQGTRSLELSLNDEPIAEYQIGARRADFETDPLSLADGPNTLRFLDRGDGKSGVVFLSPNLSDDGGEA